MASNLVSLISNEDIVVLLVQTSIPRMLCQILSNLHSILKNNLQ